MSGLDKYKNEIQEKECIDHCAKALIKHDGRDWKYMTLKNRLIYCERVKVVIKALNEMVK